MNYKVEKQERLGGWTDLIKHGGWVARSIVDCLFQLAELVPGAAEDKQNLTAELKMTPEINNRVFRDD